MPKINNRALISVFLFLVVSLGFYYLAAKYTSVPGLKNGFVEKSKDGDTKKKTEYDSEFFKKAKKSTYKELKDESPDLVQSPNIYDTQARKEFEKTVNVSEPENYFVVYDGKELVPSSINVLQGDIVTWKNKSKSTLIVNGEDGWGSGIEVVSGRAFSQQFDYIGTYKYSISGNSDVAGEVVVAGR